MQKDVVKICMGSSCFSRGNKENLEIIKKFLEENNIDSEVSLLGNLCEGKCKTGPNIFLNDKLYQNVTTEKVEEILNDIKKGFLNVRS